jgi:hypothetical protein
MPTIERNVLPFDSRVSPRFWSKVEFSLDGCWIWTANVNGGGYGQVSMNKTTYRAHRVFYEALVGPIETETLDHLCRVRACVNPSHLEPVTMRENTLRGVSPVAVNAKRTTCVAGHALTTDNVYVTYRGFRHCRTCQRSMRLLCDRRRRAKRRAALAALDAGEGVK